MTSKLAGQLGRFGVWRGTPQVSPEPAEGSLSRAREGTAQVRSCTSRAVEAPSPRGLRASAPRTCAFAGACATPDRTCAVPF